MYKPQTLSGQMTRAMALNLADWHTASVQHFGVVSDYTATLWWRQPGGSGIYLGRRFMMGNGPMRTYWLI